MTDPQLWAAVGAHHVEPATAALAESPSHVGFLLPGLLSYRVSSTPLRCVQGLHKVMTLSSGASAQF